MSEIKKRFISLIGAGRWGANLLRDFHSLGVLDSVCETSPILVEKYKEMYPDLLFYSSVDQMASESKKRGVTAVAIATPATSHFDVVTLCLNLGFDVYVEKPLALKYTRGRELVELADRLGKRLMVGHLLQYHPAIIEIKRMIKDDVIGRVRYIKSNRLNLGQIRTGENVLWSFAPHDISVILGLLDDNLPNRVICDGFSSVNPPICDSTTTIMHFDHQYAEICVNWLYPYKEQSLIIVGERGMITFKDSRTNPELFVYPQPVSQDDDGNIILNKGEPRKVLFKQDSPLTMECRHFVECCLDRNKVCRTSGEEALRVLAVLQMAQTSLERQGRSVSMVDIMEDNEVINGSDCDMHSVASEKCELEYFVHPSAVVESGCQIGKHTKIWHWSHLMPCTVGEDCSFGQGVYVGNGVKIGNGCRIQNNVNIYSGVELEDGVFLGPSCTTTNDKNPRAMFSKGGQWVPTLIKRGASVGAAAVIVCGVTLGENCMVGAGAVVTKDVPDGALVVGNPAKVVGMVSAEGEIVWNT